MSVESVDILREKQDREEMEQILGTPLPLLVKRCDEQMLLRIWSLAINKGIEIGRQRAVKAESEKLQGLTYTPGGE